MIVIIGVLITGILRMQEFISSARAKETVRDWMAYTSAMHSFKDKYSMFPGDSSTAAMRVPDCNAANACYNGNGNGIIGRVIGYNQNQINMMDPQEEETMQFWKHIALNGYLHDIVDPTWDATNGLSWGVSHPKTPWDSGYTIMTAQLAGPQDEREVWLRLQDNLTSPSVPLPGTGSLKHVIPIKYAEYIDTLKDDGLCSSGIVKSWCFFVDTMGNASTICGLLPGSPAEYNISDNPEAGCLLYLNLEK